MAPKISVKVRKWKSQKKLQGSLSGWTFFCLPEQAKGKRVPKRVFSNNQLCNVEKILLIALLCDSLIYPLLKL